MGNPEIFRRWEVAPDLPNSPCADFALESLEDGSASLILRYSWVVGNDRDMRITVQEVRALRTLWDGDGVGGRPDYPLCTGYHAGITWPLIEVQNSSWLAGLELATSVAITSHMKDRPWRHFKVVALERGLDLMARGSITAEWLERAL